MATEASALCASLHSDSSKWLNLVERWFGKLTDKRIRRAAFMSVNDLVAAINEYMQVWNRNPKPLFWTVSAESIMTKLSLYKTNFGKDSARLYVTTCS
jgi:hypothetical protein